MSLYLSLSYVKVSGYGAYYLFRLNTDMLYLIIIDQQRSSSSIDIFSQCTTVNEFPAGGQTYDWSSGLERMDDSELYFAPERGNVVFASASDVWGFRPADFVGTWADRLAVPADRLKEAIWGDWYVTKSAAATTLKPNARKHKRKPVFVQLVLEPVWKAYQVL